LAIIIIKLYINIYYYIQIYIYIYNYINRGDKNMFLGFKCKNFTSYYDEAQISMLASSKDEYRELNTFNTGFGELLKSTLIYGANGSGKSNLISAVDFMKSMVQNSFFDESIIKRCEKFKFRIKSEDEPSMFEIVFIKDDVLYQYGFEISDNNINGEWLYRKSRRMTPLFIRKGSHYDSIELKGELTTHAEAIKQHVRENALFISTAAMFNIPIAKIVRDWFSNDLHIITPDYDTPADTVSYLETDEKKKNEVLDFLKRADFSIEDFELNIKEEKVNEKLAEIISKQLLKNLAAKENTNINLKRRLIDLKTKHYVYDDNNKSVDEILLPFVKYQSNGTIKFFELAGPILDSLKNGKTIFIDEIDSRLHCALVRYIISLFNSIDKNIKNAQLICTTHDVLLLEEPIRRDQIWFVQKNQYGESDLYSLNDFKDIRKNDLLLKKYLLGVFGAIPFIKER